MLRRPSTPQATRNFPPVTSFCSQVERPTSSFSRSPPSSTSAPLSLSSATVICAAAVLRSSSARRVPDRRRPGALLHRRRHDLGRRDPERGGLDRGPARRRDLEHAHVVERVEIGVEVGIRPGGLELHRSDRVRVARLLDVHRAADRRHRTGDGVGLPAPRPRDVVDLLEALAALRPALHDLDPVEIARGGILHRPHQERRRLAGDRRRQVAAHRDALGVAGLEPVLLLHCVVAVLPAAEEAHLQVRTAGPEGLLLPHAVEERRARVLGGPDAGQARGVLVSACPVRRTRGPPCAL